MTKKGRRLEPIDEDINLFKVKKTKNFIKKKKFSHSKNFTIPKNFKKSRQIHQNQEKAIQIRHKPWVAKFQTTNNITQKGSKKGKSDKKKMDENDPQLQKLRDKLLTMGLEKMDREDAEKLMRKECQKLYTSESSYPKIDFKSPISNNKKDVNGNKKESGNIFLDILGVSKPKPLFTLEDDPNDGNRNDKDPENERPSEYDHLSEIKNENLDESIIFEGEVQKSQKDFNFSMHEPRRQDIEVICLDDTDAKMNPLSSDDEIEILPGPSTSSKLPIQQKTFPKKSGGSRQKTPTKEDFLKQPPLKQATLPWHKPSNPTKNQNLHEPDPDSGEEDNTMAPKIVRTITLFPTRRNQNEKEKFQRSLPDLNLYLDSISHYAAKMKNFHFRGMEKVNSNVQDLFSLGLKPTPLRIVSYNVLCQTTILRTNYLYQHLSRNPYFGGNRRTCLEWKMRQNLLALELANLKADVYCLQEVEYTHYLSFFDPLMRERGYKGFYTQKTGTNADGCAIFIRFEKLQHVFLEQIRFNFQTEFMDKDNVAQILCVKFTGTDRHLLIGNTHILFNKNRGDIKLNQLAVFFAHINQAMGKIPKNSGLILCGDFNLEPFSKVYEFITEGQLEFGDCPRNELSGQGHSGGPVLRTFCVPSRCLVTNNCLFRKANEPHTECVILQHPLKLASVYEHTLPGGSKEISTYHKDDGCPDYIFYTVKKKIPESENMRKIVESGIHLVQRLSLPSTAHYDMAFGKLPNEYAGSDHIPLLADFYIV